MTGGSDEAPVVVVAYDPTWPAQFLQERARLEDLLAAWLAGPIEHIGSTAIPGMIAKPVIDLMAPVDDLDASRPAIAVVAFTGTFSQYCLTKALSYAQTSFVMPIDFSRVPLSALIGWLLYDEQIDVYTALGALLIVGGNLLNLPRRPGGPTAPGDTPDGSPDEAPQPAAAMKTARLP